jgi:tetratricopeptide (TPR) repeat protein
MAYGAGMMFRPIPFLFAALLMAAPTTLVASPAAQPDASQAAGDRAADLLAQARAAESRGETELALRLAQSAIVAAPAQPNSYVALGDIYAESGHPDFARTYYDAALEIDPAEARAQKAIAALDHTARPVLAAP